LVSMKDVAAAAGVSTATVSRVLANKPHITDEIRDKVHTAVRNLEYRPNRIARNLRNRQSSTIGLIVSDLSNNPFFNFISQAIEEMAYARGYAVLLFNSDEDPAKEAICLELLKDELVAGVIIAPTSETANAMKPPFDLDIPVVVINRKIQSMSIDSVLIDNYDCAYRLIGHLLEDGYQRIGGLFSKNNNSVRARYEGFRQVLQDRGIVQDAQLEYFSSATEEEGYKGTGQLLGLPNRPEVIFASNGSLATGAFKRFRDEGVRIPDDVALVCFDEFPWMSMVDPQITVIRQPTYDIGKVASELLFSRMADPKGPTRDVVLHGELLIRDSCRHASFEPGTK
jgi:LacI family transcriptional regulator, fructose operon transcriptional repressor